MMVGLFLTKLQYFEFENKKFKKKIDESAF